jgi:hypothetical protein
LLSLNFLAMFAPAVAKVYIVSFRTHDDRRPSRFIVPGRQYEISHQDGLGACFQSRFDKSTAQAE